MEINKQLFEDILSGKLKGKFVLRNGSIISSDGLSRAQQTKVIAAQSYPYTIEGGGYYCYYTESGRYLSDYIYHNLDIINFIPDKNMETKELKIEIPEGQEIDWQESAKQEKIVFKKKDTKPRSWKEYCNNFKGQYCYIQDNRDNIGISFTPNGFISAYKNIIPTKKLAEAFLAMMQLMSLRQAWIGDWKPEKDTTTLKRWNIVYSYSEELFCLFPSYVISYALSFPTQEMAEDFRNCFKDLLNVAKPLI